MVELKMKPLSVNLVWAGRRFKTPAYKKYEIDCLFLLPRLQLPPPPYKLTLVFSLSNIGNDIDNSCKPLIDILQKKYNFNDKLIMELAVFKHMVPKGQEKIDFKFEHSDFR
jgi:hypothetical protein